MKRFEIRNVSKSFNQRTVVDDVSLVVNPGETVGLLGPNGAGKTTTFFLALGLHAPDRGSIWLNELDITGMPVYQRARLGLSFLPQEPSIFRGLSVAENINAILEIHRGRSTAGVDELLAEMGILHLKKRKAYQLSGGERRRLEIARSLLFSPQFLLLDEPFAGIDPIQISEVQKLVLSLRDRGIGIIITDHNVREILKISDRAYIVNRGRIIFQGPSGELIHDQRVKEEYLGQDFRWN